MPKPEFKGKSKPGVEEDSKFDKKGKKFGKGKPEFSKTPKVNDPAYYTKYKTLSETVAKIAFNHRNGGLLDVELASSGTPADKRRISSNIDPILVLAYMPTPGNSSSLESGINITAEAAYKVLNRKYRGSATSRYQSADLAIAQFALLDFYCSLAQAERAYGVAQVAKVNQKQLPREMLFAMGYDADEMMTNLANFRTALNKMIIRAQALCLVKGYSLLDHHLYLLGNLFKDKDTARGQYYVYRKFGYWKWDPTSYATGSALRWITSNSAKTMKMNDGNNSAYYSRLQTTDEIILELKAQLDPLLADSDIDAICSDILAYFGNEDDNPNLVKVQSLPEDYMVEATYNKEALLQLHNTTIISNLGIIKQSGTWDFGVYLTSPFWDDQLPSGATPSDYQGVAITQRNGVVEFGLEMPGGGTRSLIKFTNVYHTVGQYQEGESEIRSWILDTDELNPTTDQVIEYTRQMVLVEELAHTNDAQTYYYTNFVKAMGSFVCHGAVLFRFMKVGINPRDSGDNLVYAATEAMLDQFKSRANYITMSSICKLSKFDWAPVLTKYNTNIGGQDFIGDLDNYTVLDVKTLFPIHEAAVMSEFHNPIADVLLKDE